MKLLVWWLIFLVTSCSDSKKGIEMDLNKRLGSGEDLEFRIIDLDEKKKAAEIEILLDLEGIDAEVYLSKVNKLEEILEEKGIIDIRYRVINKKETSMGKKEWGVITKKKATKQSNKIIKMAGWNKGLKLLKMRRGRVNYNFVRVRKGGNWGNEIKTYLFKGTIVKVTKRSQFQEKIGVMKEYWYQIETKDKKRGWIFGEYLSVTQEKKLSSSLHNNRIYMSFLNEREKLLGKVWKNWKDSNGRRLRIDEKNIVINSSMGGEGEGLLKIPFKIKNQEVFWEKGEILKKGVEKKGMKRKEGKEEEEIINFIFQKEAKGDESQWVKKEKKDIRHYTLRIGISPYLRRLLSGADYKMIEVALKIVYQHLMRGNHGREDVIFYKEVNIKREILELEILGLDWDKKEGRLGVKKVRFERGRSREIFTIGEELRFKGYKVKKQKLVDYEWVAGYLPKQKSFVRKEVISLGNYIVDYMISRKYI